MLHPKTHQHQHLSPVRNALPSLKVSQLYYRRFGCRVGSPPRRVTLEAPSFCPNLRAASKSGCGITSPGPAVRISGRTLPTQHTRHFSEQAATTSRDSVSLLKSRRSVKQPAKPWASTTFGRPASSFPLKVFMAIRFAFANFPNHTSKLGKRIVKEPPS